MALKKKVIEVLHKWGDAYEIWRMMVDQKTEEVLERMGLDEDED